MNTLNGVRTTAHKRLRNQSRHVLGTTETARRCAYYLHDIGCTVQNIEIRRDHAIIHIDPPQADQVHGSIHVRRCNRGVRETVYVASVMRCQVQWVIPDQPVQFAQGA